MKSPKLTQEEFLKYYNLAKSRGNFLRVSIKGRADWEAEPYENRVAIFKLWPTKDRCDRIEIAAKQITHTKEILGGFSIDYRLKEEATNKATGAAR